MTQEERDVILVRTMRLEREVFNDLNHAAVNLRQIGSALQQLGAALAEPNSVPTPLSAVPRALQPLPSGLVDSDQILALVRKYAELKHALIEVQTDLRALRQMG
jgi:hypothetical protein